MWYCIKKGLKNKECILSNKLAIIELKIKMKIINFEIQLQVEWS